MTKSFKQVGLLPSSTWEIGYQRTTW